MYARLYYKVKKIDKKARDIISLNIPSEKGNIMTKDLQKKSDQMTRSINRVVICLVLCFLPYLGWLNYYYLNITTRAESDGHYKVHQYEVKQFFKFI